MSVPDLRQQATQRLAGLSTERLRVADDFLAYLEDRESDEATAELLALPGIVQALREAEEDIKAERWTSVDKLQRKE